jgi:hypothetical protein
MEKQAVIKGIVLASKWGDNGAVSGLSIHGYDQKEYIVQMNHCGKKMLDFLQELICATGKVSRTIDGQDTINVSHFYVSDIKWDSSSKLG